MKKELRHFKLTTIAIIIIEIMYLDFSFVCLVIIDR